MRLGSIVQAPQGEFASGRYRYDLSIRPTTDPSPRVPTQVPVEPVQAANAAKLFRVELNVSWGAATPAQRLHFVLLRARAPQLVSSPAVP